MPLRLTNTLTGRKEQFDPIRPPEVRMYVCGVNLYGPAHVGHAMSYVVFDMVRRYLEWSGFRVRHVQNFTDVEDRIVAKAAAEGRTIQEIADENIARYFREMDALNVTRAHVYPRATHTIPKILEIVKGLVDKGHAYAVDGDVYFRVTGDPDYGKLSRRHLEDMQAGARIAIDKRKEHPMDFALWTAAKPGEPSWDSPWGPGLPGWHIECSAMVMDHLGEQIDIHGGGHDVMFPHHENEIAQSESFTGKPFVKYWLHNALLRLGDQEEKMTRHLGNIISIEDALRSHTPDGLRIFLLSSHYRNPLTWKEEAVAAADRGAERLRGAVEAAAAVVRRAGPEAADAPAATALRAAAARAREAFREAMDDDFNSPTAIAELFALATEINRVADGVAKRLPDAGDPENAAGALTAAADTLRELAGVLGLRLAAPPTSNDEVERHVRRLAGEEPALADVSAEGATLGVLLDRFLEARQAARRRKDFSAADRIRERLAQIGVSVEDFPGGSRWRLK